MNREEAKLILDAHTLVDANATAAEDPQLREARELMREDAELGRWFAARVAADERIAQAVAAVEVPPHLRDQLLALADSAPPTNVVKFPAYRMILFALAASLVAGLTGIVWNTIFRTPEMPGWESDSLAMVQKLDSGKTDLDRKTHDLAEIKGFLASAKAPSPGGLPPNLPVHPPVGCKSFRAAGLPSSVVCFEMSPGLLAHLVTVSAGPETSGALVGKPQFAQNGDWHTAVWSDGKQTYVLGTRASMDELKRLFS